MGHGIENDDWMVSGEGLVPWHGIGSVVDGLLTTREILVTAKLDGWGLDKLPVFDGDGNEIPDYFAVRRMGTDGKTLGIVKGRYTIVSNESAFDWADYLIGGGAQATSAGSIFGGKRVFLALKLPFAPELPNAEGKAVTYLVIDTTHDGSGCVHGRITTVRPVCNNTIQAGIAAQLREVKIRHARNAEEKLSEAQRVLGLAQGAADAIEKRAEELYRTKVNDEQFKRILTELVPLPTLEVGKDTSRGLTMASNVQEKIGLIYHNHDTQDGIRGTAWGAVNAVSYYTNHVQTRRETAGATKEENRMVAILENGGLDSKVLEVLESGSWR
jgi:phage/plasmid-like protein (TIGR03299 family)